MCGDFCCYLEVVWYYGYVVWYSGLGFVNALLRVEPAALLCGGYMIWNRFALLFMRWGSGKISCEL